VRVQDDFYEHVNREWLAANPVPSDYSRWGTFEELNKVNEEQLRTILSEGGEGGDWASVQTLWTQGQDETRLNSERFSEVLADFIEKIGCIESTADLTDVIMYWFYHGVTCPVSMGAHPDLKNSDLMILAIDRSGLGLPDRDMYFLETWLRRAELIGGWCPTPRLPTPRLQEWRANARCSSPVPLLAIPRRSCSSLPRRHPLPPASLGGRCVDQAVRGGGLTSGESFARPSWMAQQTTPARFRTVACGWSRIDRRSCRLPPGPL